MNECINKYWQEGRGRRRNGWRREGGRKPIKAELQGEKVANYLMLL